MGLLKTAATVAVASSVHGRIQRRQQNRWAAQDQATRRPCPHRRQRSTRPRHTAAGLRRARRRPSRPADMNDRLAQLKQLGELLSAGVLTQAEFEQQKARILNG